MRKIWALMMIFILVSFVPFSIAQGDELTTLSTEQLIEMRSSINNELASRIVTEQQQMIADGTKTLREMFPCIALAKMIRDEAGMISIDQPGLPELLSKVSSVSSYDLDSDEIIDDLSGIEYLTNLNSLSLYNNDECGSIKKLPEGFYTLTNLYFLDLSGTSITSFSEDLGNMVKLRSIDISFTDFVGLPDSIGNLTNLSYINIQGAPITKLPNSFCNLINLEKFYAERTLLEHLPDDIGNLTSLKELSISFTNISSLPLSIYNLKLNKFDKKGLNID